MNDKSNQSPDELFWALAAELEEDSSVTEGTMMGFPCLRVSTKFFASLEHKSHRLVVKLPADRVGAGGATAAVRSAKREPLSSSQ